MPWKFWNAPSIERAASLVGIISTSGVLYMCRLFAPVYLSHAYYYCVSHLVRECVRAWRRRYSCVVRAEIASLSGDNLEYSLSLLVIVKRFGNNIPEVSNV